jgi:hypothetical protein
MADYLLGLDLGQASDYTALAIAEKIKQYGEKTTYHFRHLERFKLGTTYPDVIRRLQVMIEQEPLKDNYKVIADQTGVGRPVVDMLREAGLNVAAVTITGGNEATRSGSDYHVPKRELVSSLQILLQSGRLKFAENMPEVQTIVTELLNFKVKITTSAHDTYEAWREGIHDDLVLAAAMAVWFGEDDSDWFFT